VEDEILACEDESVALSIDVFDGDLDDAEILWSTGEKDPSIIVNEPGNYQITVSNDCEVIVQQVEVRVDEDIFDKVIYVPNIFSPNGDEVNDVFSMAFKDDVIVKINEFTIFDRWGNRVFSTDDPLTVWDGKQLGKKLRIGVYVWYLDAEISTCHVQGKNIFKYGDVTLVR